MKQHKSIKIEQSLIGKIEELAAKENRSFNNMVETIIHQHFDPRTVDIKTVPYEDNNFMELKGELQLSDYEVVFIASHCDTYNITLIEGDKIIRAK